MLYLRERQLLNAKVRKVNEVRKVLNEYTPQVIEQLKPFIGQKIIKADEYLVKKFSDKVKFLVGLRDTVKIKPLVGFDRASISNIYVNTTKYSIQLKISVSFQDSDHSCSYQDDVIYIGDIKQSWSDGAENGSLETVHEFTPLPMLSAAQEWKKYVKAAKAKEALEQATDAMFYGLREWVR
jgi:hypothetical protein